MRRSRHGLAPVRPFCWLAALGVPLVLLFITAGARPASADATVFAPRAVPGHTTVVDVWCGARATSASVNVVPIGGPPELPLEPYPAGGPGAFRVAYLVPAGTEPGRYDLTAECDNGQAGDATVVVGLATDARTADPGRGRVLLAFLISAGVLAALAGAGIALVRWYGRRSHQRA